MYCVLLIYLQDFNVFSTHSALSPASAQCLLNARDLFRDCHHLQLKLQIPMSTSHDISPLKLSLGQPRYESIASQIELGHPVTNTHRSEKTFCAESSHFINHPPKLSNVVLRRLKMISFLQKVEVEACWSIDRVGSRLSSSHKISLQLRLGSVNTIFSTKVNAPPKWIEVAHSFDSSIAGFGPDNLDFWHHVHGSEHFNGQSKAKT